MIFPIIGAALGLAQFAPSITKLLNSSNAKDVASNVVNLAQEITKTKCPQEASKLLEQNSQMVINFQKEILKLEAEQELFILKDRQSARERDIALAQVGRKNNRADIMVISAGLGLIACLVTLSSYSKSLPGEAVGIISTICGIFGSCLKDAYAFEFGSSRSSEQKDLLLSLNKKSYNR